EVRIWFKGCDWSDVWAHTALQAAISFMDAYPDQPSNEGIIYRGRDASRFINIRWTEARVLVAEVHPEGEK
ncbi:MAG: hypothetical protein ACPHCN_09320, partial [Mycobacterium sp.]